MTFSIIAEHLTKKFGPTLAVDDLNLQVACGEIYGLVGSDGAGKTSTMRLLVGALKPDSGDASICGFSVSRQIEQVRSQTGYLSQRFSLYEDLTVLENIRFFAEVRGLSQQEWLPRCMEILKFVGLEAFKDRHAGQLSGGMKQKLGLASALVTRPKVLLLDEPTTGVDPVTRQDFWQLLIRLVSPSLESIPTTLRIRDSESGRHEEVGDLAVILTTPYMDEASRCHRLGFMRQGRIIIEGTPSQLRSRLEGLVLEVGGISLPSLRLAAKQTNGIEDVRAFGDKLHIRILPGQAESVIATLRSVFHGREGEKIEVRTVTPTLDDVFISLAEI